MAFEIGERYNLPGMGARLIWQGKTKRRRNGLTEVEIKANTDDNGRHYAYDERWVLDRPPQHGFIERAVIYVYNGVVDHVKTKWVEVEEEEEEEEDEMKSVHLVAPLPSAWLLTPPTPPPAEPLHTSEENLFIRSSGDEFDDFDLMDLDELDDDLSVIEPGTPSDSEDDPFASFASLPSSSYLNDGCRDPIQALYSVAEPSWGLFGSLAEGGPSFGDVMEF
jgi:hypothetical protein